MSGRFPIGKPRFPSWGLPLLAVTLTLTVHALWLVFPQPEPAPIPEPATVRLFAYPNLDARTWSPTLFSLPSSLGFSGAIRSNTNNVRPPLQSPLTLTDSFSMNFTEIFPEPGLETSLSMRSRLPITGLSLSPKPSPVSPSYEWSLKILEGDDSKLELNRLPSAPENENTLVLTGVMTFGPAGQVTSLFLEPNTLDEDTRLQVIRALRRVRRSAPTSEARIRFRFAYQPSEDGE